MDAFKCPTNCVLYRSRGWNVFRKRVASVGIPFKTMWKFFVGAHTATQVAVIFVFIGIPAFLVILKFAPTWVPPLIQLIQAVRGK